LSWSLGPASLRGQMPRRAARGSCASCAMHPTPQPGSRPRRQTLFLVEHDARAPVSAPSALHPPSCSSLKMFQVLHPFDSKYEDKTPTE
jgi:hypothetical protein